MKPSGRAQVFLGLSAGAVAGWFLLMGTLGGDLREGEAAIAGGRPDLAEAAFRRALTRDPTSERAMYGIGWAWHMAGEEDEAREAFRLLAEVHPDSPLGYKGIGSVWMAEGNAKEARASFEVALQKAADGPHAIKIEDSLALLALSGQDGPAALSAFDALLARDPDRAEFHWGRAEALLLLNRGDEAMIEADEAVACAVGAGARLQGMSLITRARTLLEVSGGRVDAGGCQQTAPPVYAWLAQADRDLDQAQALGMDLPSIQGVRRTVLDRRGKVDDICPGQRPLRMPGVP